MSMVNRTLLFGVGLSMGSGSSEHGEPFEAVRLCKDIEAFNEFVRRYLADHCLFGERARRTYWALLHAWKA